MALVTEYRWAEEADLIRWQTRMVWAQVVPPPHLLGRMRGISCPPMPPPPPTNPIYVAWTHDVS